MRLQRGEEVLMETQGPVVVQHFTDSYPQVEKPYVRWTAGTSDGPHEARRVVSQRNEDEWAIYELAGQDGPPSVEFRYRTVPGQGLRAEFKALNAPNEDARHHSRMALTFRSDAEDDYYGMGMRFNRVNHKGTVVTNWAHEVGENLPAIAAAGTPEGRDTTYYPVPFFLNLKGYGFLLDSFYYSEFDFAASKPNQLKVTNYAAHLRFDVFVDSEPLGVIDKYNKKTGRWTKPPPWAFGVWAAASSDWQTLEDGQDINYRMLEKHRAQGVPLSAIMAEDWYWAFTKFPPLDAWEVNRDHYPDYEKMIADQHAAGVRHIGYFLPYFDDDFPGENSVYDQGDEAGYFTKTPSGETYLFDFFIWDEAQLDTSNPSAVEWFRDSFYSKAANWGVDGWMNDFGEYTPYDSRSANGEWGWSMHNRYPLLWAEAAKGFWEKERPDGDYVFFSRSGYTGQQANVPFHFTGDRNASYERLSGLGGQIPGVLSAGLSAHPNTSIDIGAYNCEGVEPMGKLLMFRWIEMGALIPIMRLHRGQPLCDHWRVDEDEATFDHWKRYAQLHTQLFPYIYTLAAQGEQHGWPMVRHLALHYPNDSTAREQDYQFLLGDRILVAPVIEEEIPFGGRASLGHARQTWQVYLPEPDGNWRHYWSDKAFSGGQSYEVSAPPGELPLFFREGKIVPTYDREIDTLVRGVKDPKIRDFEFADASMEILFFGYGSDELELWDGSVISCGRAEGEAGSCSVSGGPDRSYSYSFIN